MQRIGTLIDKLKEQYDAHAGANALLLTTQMLINELSTAADAGVEQHDFVSVLMPAKPVLPQQTQEAEAAVQPEEKAVEPLMWQPDQEEVEDTVASPEESATEEQPEPEAKPLPKENKKPLEFINAQQWLFDIETEIPTLAQQPSETVQLNEANSEAETLNDKLKSEQKELASVLKETPIKDLKKAIGINDRYQFINELFRGDESMFERSLKTINSFHIYGEAEYWIKRELKLKLGWNEESETVKHFDHLVRRRFS